MTQSTDPQEFSWAVPVMRAGYAGRSLVYLCVAGVSLSAIMQGGQARGTSEALAEIERSSWGTIGLGLICLGMACYGIWRLIDSAYDLEDYGADAKGVIARLGMVATGVVHLALGFVAANLIIGISSSSGGGSTIASGVAAVMELPAGRWIIGVGALITMGAGIYYLKKGYTRSYRSHLRTNQTIQRLDPALAAGVVAQGIIVLGVGALFFYSSLTANPSEAGGVAKVFSWLYSHPFGYVLVTLICLGLLGFSLFCAINAWWRVVPKAADPDVETLAHSLKDTAEAHT